MRRAKQRAQVLRVRHFVERQPHGRTRARGGLREEPVAWQVDEIQRAGVQHESLGIFAGRICKAEDWV